MALLKDILFGVSLKTIVGDRNLEIKGITFDSRKVKEGFVFVAVRGLTVDGHQYITQALAKGAIAVIYENPISSKQDSVTYVETNSSSEALGIVASNFYNKPSEKIKLVGITGTNGKTSCATLLFQLFHRMGYAVGLISTIENRINETIINANFTTPDAVQLNELLSDMVGQGCTHCFMEVSSHSLVQNRVAGVHFTGGVFTNITHDHLDYHKTFDNYVKAKKLLFDMLTAESFALVNSDDKRGQVMLQNTNASKYSYAIKSMGDYRGRILQNTLQGLELNIDGVDVWFGLIGAFNAYNLLAVYGTALLLGEQVEEVLSGMSLLKGVNGRFHTVNNPNQILAIVDYAHTPDALENVLASITDLRTKSEMLITVVGCGGDRDRDKRPEMAKIAAKLSDKVILTSDNPRTEDPYAILQDMKEGVPKSLERNVLTIEDRREAIRTACSLAKAGDIILVAGKGHETYQEVNGERFHFDDKEILTEELN